MIHGIGLFLIWISTGLIFLLNPTMTNSIGNMKKNRREALHAQLSPSNSMERLNINAAEKNIDPNIPIKIVRIVSLQIHHMLYELSNILFIHCFESLLAVLGNEL